jgi:hypothetical protein
MSNALSKYLQMKKNLKKHDIFSNDEKEIRDRRMKKEADLLNNEKIKAERNNIKEILIDAKEHKNQNIKRISEEKKITEILEDLLLKKNYTEDNVRITLNKKPELFQNIDMYFIKDKIEEILIIREEQTKYNNVIKQAKKALENAKKKYPFLM